MALTEYHHTDPADMHPALAQARFGTRRKADRMVGFWLALIVEAQQSRPNVRTARRHARELVASRDFLTAVAEAGQDAVDRELVDGARIYFTSALEDSAYTSTLMRMRRMNSAQVREKAALQVVRTTALIQESGLEESLIRWLLHGYLAALAPHGVRELRESTGRHPRAEATLATILDEDL